MHGNSILIKEAMQPLLLLFRMPLKRFIIPGLGQPMTAWQQMSASNLDHLLATQEDRFVPGVGNQRMHHEQWWGRLAFQLVNADHRV